MPTVFSKNFIRFIAGTVSAFLIAFFAFPISLFQQKENKLLDKVSIPGGDGMPTVEASDQFACGSSSSCTSFGIGGVGCGGGAGCGVSCGFASGYGSGSGAGTGGACGGK